VSPPRVWNCQELLKRRHRGRFLGWLALAAFVLLALVLFRLLYLTGPVRVTVASGKTEPTVHQFLLSIAHDTAESELDIEPVIATGTIDVLNQVDAGKVDLSEKHRERLPDAVFISTMPPSDLVRRLVVQFDFRLIPLPFGDAFRLTALQHAARFVPTEGIRREHIVDATIPAYAYEASPAVPPQSIATLGLRVLVITNVRTPRATVTKLLDRIIASRFAEAMQPTLDAGIVRQHAELPWHPGAIDYRRRDEPLITGEGLGVISNALQVLPSSASLSAKGATTRWCGACLRISPTSAGFSPISNDPGSWHRRPGSECDRPSAK
jgi:hypothetical protein